MDRVTTEHTRVHVKGAGVRVEGGTCSAEGVVMGTLLTEKVNAIIDVSRSNGYSTGVDHTMYGFTIPLPTTPVSEDEREGTHSEVSWMS